MDGMSQNARILLVVGIVLIVLCALGMAAQWSTYTEYASDRPFHAQSSGSAFGARGGAMQSMIAWNKSSQSKADKAMNMFIFMVVGCALGVVCVIYALRRPKPVPEPEHDRHDPHWVDRR